MVAYCIVNQLFDFGHGQFLGVKDNCGLLAPVPDFVEESDLVELQPEHVGVVEPLAEL